MNKGIVGKMNLSSLWGRSEYVATKKEAQTNTGRALGSSTAPW